MVEKDSVGGKHAVRLTVVLHRPERIQLRDSVRRAGIERRCLLLWNLLHLSVKLRGRGLIETHGFPDPGFADGLQKPHGSERIYITGELRAVERHAHVALRSKIVHLVGLNVIHEP